MLMTEQKLPLPPFTEETAWRKVRGAESAWNSRDPEKVSMAYSPESEWRNRDTFLIGRHAIREFLTLKWARETDYALRKDLWTFAGNRIAVRFQYESKDLDGQWWRSYGNENWEFDEHGLMRRREASINDIAIDESDRQIFGVRPALDTTGVPLR
jgi:nuclear transport factor 2 (NTF2) superfamily protein